MYKILLLLIISVLGSFSSRSQQLDSVTYMEYAKAETDTLTSRLQLTETQVHAVDSVVTNYFKTLAMLTGQELSDSIWTDSLSACESTLHTALEAIFSQQQYTQYQTLMEERRTVMLQRIEADRLKNLPAAEQQ